MAQFQVRLRTVPEEARLIAMYIAITVPVQIFSQCRHPLTNQPMHSIFLVELGQQLSESISEGKMHNIFLPELDF